MIGLRVFGQTAPAAWPLSCGQASPGSVLIAARRDSARSPFATTHGQRLMSRARAISAKDTGAPAELVNLKTRGSVPITARPSVRCVPVIARSLELNELEGSVKERFETRIALTLRMFRSAAHGDVERAPQDEWSDRGLQVLDLKAAGALSCSCVVEAI